MWGSPVGLQQVLELPTAREGQGAPAGLRWVLRMPRQLGKELGAARGATADTWDTPMGKGGQGNPTGLQRVLDSQRGAGGSRGAVVNTWEAPTAGKGRAGQGKVSPEPGRAALPHAAPGQLAAGNQAPSPAGSLEGLGSRCPAHGRGIRPGGQGVGRGEPTGLWGLPGSH